MQKPAGGIHNVTCRYTIEIKAREEREDLHLKLTVNLIWFRLLD
jgi:hypothetical protein